MDCHQFDAFPDAINWVGKRAWAPHVHVKQTNVSASSADLTITVKLSNAKRSAVTARLKATVHDANDAVVATTTGTQALSAQGKADATLQTTLTIRTCGTASLIHISTRCE